jgi:hypothetical protein
MNSVEIQARSVEEAVRLDRPPHGHRRICERQGLPLRIRVAIVTRDPLITG